MDLDRPLRQQFPPFARVWHRASGDSGIVIGYVEYCDGTERVYVDHGGGCVAEFPQALTLTDPEKEFETEGRVT